jgi:predicted metal-dependent phosphoesterase TrpH
VKLAELHCHTVYSNKHLKWWAESLVSPRKLLEAAQRAGLSAIAVTDHNTMIGNLEVQKLAGEYGIVVIPAEEIDTNRRGQVLAYGIKEEVAPKRPAKEIIADIKKQGGVAVVPHPFDPIKGMEDLDVAVGLADGLEVMNGGTWTNKKAMKYALFNKTKVRTGGSDAHHQRLIGSVAAGFPNNCVTAEDYVKCLKEGNFQIVVRRKHWKMLAMGGANIIYSRIRGWTNRKKYLL